MASYADYVDYVLNEGTTSEQEDMELIRRYLNKYHGYVDDRLDVVIFTVLADLIRKVDLD